MCRWRADTRHPWPGVRASTGPGRAFLPNAWDIVGGHVEPGESLCDALRREVIEETGWVLAGSPELIHVTEWLDDTDGSRREFDFLVEVRGDLERPQLEWPKHVDFRWVGPDEVALLDENRGADGGLARKLVELAHASASAAARLALPHATIFLDPVISTRVDELRRYWDPAMARQIPAHVSVAYPSEIGGLEQMVDAVRQAAAVTQPFGLALSDTWYDKQPQDGVFLRVSDVDGGWSRLRREILRGGTMLVVEPHVTLVHPRTSGLGAQAWPTLRDTRIDSNFSVSWVAVTAFDGHRSLLVESVLLTG